MKSIILSLLISSSSLLAMQHNWGWTLQNYETKKDYISDPKKLYEKIHSLLDHPDEKKLENILKANCIDKAQLVEILNRKTKKGFNALAKALMAQNVRESIVRLLLTYGATPNKPNKGLSALHIALLSKPVNEKIITLLLDYGADPNQKILQKIEFADLTLPAHWTAAHIAVHMRVSVDILDILHKKNCNFFAAHKSCPSAFDLAHVEQQQIARKYFLGI